MCKYCQKTDRNEPIVKNDSWEVEVRDYHEGMEMKPFEEMYIAVYFGNMIGSVDFEIKFCPKCGRKF